MRENRTYGSEGGEPAMDNSPTPITHTPGWCVHGVAMLVNQSYNPDVLSCLANMSSDEVITPPELVNQMLDLLLETSSASFKG